MKILSTPLDILFKFLSKNLNLPRKKYEKTKFTYKTMKIANSIFKNFMKIKVILWKANTKKPPDKIRNFWQKFVSNIEGFYQHSMSFHESFMRKVCLKPSEKLNSEKNYERSSLNKPFKNIRVFVIPCAKPRFLQNHMKD